MDLRLWVHDDFDVVEVDVEEQVGFDDFEAFVDQGRGVDGDHRSHRPGGMVECLGGSDPAQGVAGHSAEGTARSGDDEFADFAVCAGAQRLGDGGVLAVDGHQLGPGGTSGVEDDGSADDEGFLVCQGHVRAVFESRQGCAESGGTGDRVEDHVRGQARDRLGGVVPEVDGFDGIGDPPLGSQLSQSRTHRGLASSR